MWARRIPLFCALLLLLYLGIYTFNQRTGILDQLAASTGLEIIGLVLKPGVWLSDQTRAFWYDYVDLTNVRNENDILRKENEELRTRAAHVGEVQAEVERLRTLLGFTPVENWHSVGARVLAGRLGTNASLETIIVGRGYLTGSLPGFPVATNHGLVGRVLRASPTSASVLLLTDPASRIAVISQDNRISGILVGRGMNATLDLLFVPHSATIAVDEMLVTSGLDGVFPKGMPVAKIDSVTPSDMSQFQNIKATPLADLRHLEEVLILERPADYPVQALDTASDTGASPDLHLLAPLDAEQ